MSRVEVLSHPRSDFDMVMSVTDGGWFELRLGEVVVGEGDNKEAAYRDAHMTLSILVAMLVEQGLS